MLALQVFACFVTTMAIVLIGNKNPLGPALNGVAALCFATLNGFADLWVCAFFSAAMAIMNFRNALRWRRESTIEAPSIVPERVMSFQARVLNWLMNCFSQEICRDTTERNHRFLEEALELVQSTGCTRDEAHQLVEYVFNRPIGDPFQEVGGVTITLSALCSCIDIDQETAGEAELARINAPEILEKIRAKQAAKPKFSPLPA